MVVLEEEKIEYQRANELFRHYDNIAWISASIFFSTAFAIVGLTWEVKDRSLLFAFAVISVGLWGIGFLVGRRLGFFSKQIRERMWQLEEQMGLDLHLFIRRKDQEATLRSPILHSLGRGKYLKFLIPIVLLFFWFLRITLT